MRILFLGEGNLYGPARYLAAVLTASRIRFDRRPDRANIPRSWLQRNYQAIILSDYRYSSFTSNTRRWLVEQIQEGTGLLMIGGWASFTGLVGGYAGSPIEKLLPVRCVRGDDRVNASAVLQPSPGRPWRHPPMVCGYHRCRPKAGTQTPLEFRDLRFANGRPVLGRSHPALVLGQAGRGRTAAFLTDCAPHWAGGLVDWGPSRVSISLGRYGDVEVGTSYVRFFTKLINWVGRGPQ